jgi:hypothetical protein
MLGVLGQFRHRRFRRDLSAYVDDMLSEGACRRLEAHLDSCEACRQELAELRATVEALGSLPMAEAPRSFALAAAPVAEVRPRPAARRLEFGLRLATATAAFALALVMIGDFAGLPGGGDEEEEWVRGQFLSAEQETPAALEAAPTGTPEFYGITEVPDISEAPGISDVQREPAPGETPPALEAAPVETPAAEQTPAAPEATPVGTPVAEQTPAATEAVPVETPAAEETPPATQAALVETPEPAVGADVSKEEPPEKEALEGAEVEEEAEADRAEDGAVADEEGGGLSREEVVRWLEIGLGAGVGVLVVIWALARFQRSIGNRP